MSVTRWPRLRQPAMHTLKFVSSVVRAMKSEPSVIPPPSTKLGGGDRARGKWFLKWTVYELKNRLHYVVTSHSCIGKCIFAAPSQTC